MYLIFCILWLMTLISSQSNTVYLKVVLNHCKSTVRQAGVFWTARLIIFHKQQSNTQQNTHSSQLSIYQETFSEVGNWSVWLHELGRVEWIFCQNQNSFTPTSFWLFGMVKNERFHQDVVHVKRRQQRRPLYQARLMYKQKEVNYRDLCTVHQDVLTFPGEGPEYWTVPPSTEGAETIWASTQYLWRNGREWLKEGREKGGWYSSKDN